MKESAVIWILFALLAVSPKPSDGRAAAQDAAVSGEVDESAAVAVPPASEEALRYHRSGTVLWFVNLAWGFLLPALFLFTGLSARIRTWAQRLGRLWFFVIGIYLAIFLAVNFMIDLPLAFYQGYVRPHQYGLSNQTLQKWFTDSLLYLSLGIAIGIVLLWLPYQLLRRSPRRWWLYLAILSVPLMLLGMLISPIWIDPLFNDYGPMKDKALEARIVALAERAGIDGSRVYEVNKSIDTNTVNAYVTGFGSTRRIVLWDTIIAKLDEAELLFVTGHEMGHYVLGHIWKMIGVGFLLILAALYACYRIAGVFIRRFGERWGFQQLSDIASFPLLLLLLNLSAFLLSPVALAVSRYQERESDRFGLEITRFNHSAAAAFVKLQQENLAIPRPGWLYTLWRASHPPIGERIDFCNEYRPWKTGEPLKFEDKFRGQITGGQSPH